MTEKKTNTKYFLKVFEKKSLKRPPFWFMRQAGRYLPEYKKLRKEAPNFLSFCYSPDLTVEAALQPIRLFKPDAAILFSDILVIPDALGQPTRFEENIGPILDPIISESDLSILKPERVISHLEPVFISIKKLLNHLPKSTTLIGFSGSPWTVAYYMVEGRSGRNGSTIKSWANNNPEGFQKLIDILVDVTSKYLIKQIESGAEVIQLFDSWAGLLEEEQFSKWVINPTKRIVLSIKNIFPEVPIIGFPRGSGSKTVQYVKKTGIDGISVDSSISLNWIKTNLQTLSTVQGNLDNQLLVSSDKKLFSETLKILEVLSDKPFIFNLGHGILPKTPPENVIEVSNIIRNYNHLINHD